MRVLGGNLNVPGTESLKLIHPAPPPPPSHTHTDMQKPNREKEEQEGIASKFKDLFSFLTEYCTLTYEVLLEPIKVVLPNPVTVYISCM